LSDESGKHNGGEDKKKKSSGSLFVFKSEVNSGGKKREDKGEKRERATGRIENFGLKPENIGWLGQISGGINGQERGDGGA